MLNVVYRLERESAKEPLRSVILKRIVAQECRMAVMSTTIEHVFLMKVAEAFVVGLSKLEMPAPGDTMPCPAPGGAAIVRRVGDTFQQVLRDTEDRADGVMPDIEKVAIVQARLESELAAASDTSGAGNPVDLHSVINPDLPTPPEPWCRVVSEIEDVTEAVGNYYREAMRKSDWHLDAQFRIGAGQYTRDQDPALRWVDGSCDVVSVCRETGCSEAHVTLTLPWYPEREAVFGLCYTVLHELFVHSAEQFHDTESKAERAARMCFSEGFMDAATLALLEQRAQRHETRLWELRKRAGQRRHEYRLTCYIDPDCGLDRDAWEDILLAGRAGWAALVDLGAFMQSEMAYFNAQDWPFVIAAKLNMLPMLASAKARLILNLGRVWSTPKDKHSASEEIVQIYNMLNDVLIPHRTLSQAADLLSEHIKTLPGAEFDNLI